MQTSTHSSRADDLSISSLIKSEDKGSVDGSTLAATKVASFAKTLLKYSDSATALMLEGGQLAVNVQAEFLTECFSTLLLSWTPATTCRHCIKLVAASIIKNEGYVTTWQLQKMHHTPLQGGTSAFLDVKTELLSPTIGLAFVVLYKFLTAPRKGCCLKHDVLKYMSSAYGSVIWGQSRFTERFFQCKDGDVCVAEGEMNSYFYSGISDMFKSVLPWTNMDAESFEQSASFARGSGSILTGIDKFIAFCSKIIERICNGICWLTGSFPGEVTAWIKKVDLIKVMYEEENTGYSSLSERMSKEPSFRRDVYQTYKKGTALRHKYELMDAKDKISRLINTKTNYLQKIIVDHTSSYIGTDRKDKPVLLYFYGLPGVGKTVAVDHIFTDLFYLLWKKKFKPSEDKYCHNSMSAFFDHYNYQSVFELQDFFQMRDKVTRMNEMVNILKCADESAFPLNMANCADKGTMYFCSDFIVLTSNLSLQDHRPVFSSVMEEPDAFIRRVDVNVEVRRKPGQYKVYDKNAMEFVVHTNKVSTVMDYNMFLCHLFKKYTTIKTISQGVTNCDDSFDPCRIDDIQVLISNSSTSPNECKGGDGSVSDNTLDSLVDVPPCAPADVSLPCKPVRVNAVPFQRPKKTKKSNSSQTSKNRTMKVQNSKNSKNNKFTSLIDAPVVYGESGNNSVHFKDENGNFYRPEFDDTKLAKLIADLKKNFTSYGDGALKKICWYSKKNVRVVFHEVVKVHDGGYEDVLNIDLGTPKTNTDSPSLGSLDSDCTMEITAKTESYYWDYLDSVAAKVRGLMLYVEEFVENAGEKVGNLWQRFYKWLRQCLSDQVVHSLTQRLQTYVLPTLVGGMFLLAACVHYKKVTSVVSGEATQGPSSTIPDDKPRRKGNGRSVQGPNAAFRKPKHYGIGQCLDISGKEVELPAYIEGDLSSGDGSILMHNIRPNVGHIKSKYGVMNCVALCDRVIVFVEHIVTSENDMLFASFPSGVSFSFCLRESNYIHCGKNHLYMVDLDYCKENRKIRSFSNILNYFISDNVSNLEADGFLFGTVSVATSMVNIIKLATGIKDVVSPVRVNITSTGMIYEVSDCIEYTSFTCSGDCTAPIIISHEGALSIVGLHCARSSAGPCYGGKVTREWLMEAMGSLKEIEGEMSPIVSCLATPVEYLGETQPLMHCPRKNKLRKSPFFKVGCTFVPSPLKGMFNGMTPMEISLRKSIVPAKVCRPEVFCVEQDWLLAIYQDNGNTTPRRMLTTNESIFGIPKYNIPSIATRASVGYPWCKQFVRTDLLNKEDYTVSPVLTEAVNKTMLVCSTGSTPEFVVIDMLKDEKVSVEKAALGKSRMFCILPIHINIALKNLFGCFVTHVTALHNTSPVKVGLSTSSLDAEALSHYLLSNRSDMLYMSGDFASSDRCIPFEVFMTVVQVANRWYDDGFDVSRFAIARSVFEPVHSCNGLKYKVNQGMPSGSYLTSVFNSLAYLIVIKKVFDTLDVPLESLATFGDDHVIVVHKDYVPTPSLIVDGFKEYGMTYTAGDKTSNVVWTDFESLVFLQRSIVQRYGLWFMPMDIDRVENHLMWYRSTVETRNWSLSKIVAILLETAFNEFFFHGRAVFKDRLKYYAVYFRTYNLDIFEYDNFLFNYMEICSNESHLDYFNCPTYGLFPSQTFLPALELQGEGQMGDSTDATRVGDTELTSVTENLTTFVESQKVEVTIASDSIPPMDSSFEWGADYCKSLERFFEISKVTFKSTSPAASPFLRINPVAELLSVPYLRNRIFNAKGIRFDLEVQVRVIATKFHYGQIMVLFRPGLYQNQAPLYTNKDAYVQSSWGAYDSVFTASECENTVIPITQGPPVSITQKWHYPTNWCTLDGELLVKAITNGRSLSDLSKFATFDVYKLTSMLPVDIDRPQLLIWARFVNVRLFGYVNRVIPDLVPYTYTLPAPVDFVHPSPTQKKFPKTPEIIEGEMSEVQQMQNPWGRTAQAVVEVVSCGVSYVRTFLSTLAYLGFSHPRPEQGPQLFAETSYSTANSLGISNAISLSYRADDQQASLPLHSKQSYLISEFSKKKMFYDHITLSVIGVGSTIPVDLSMTGQWGPSKVYTPAGYVAGFFKLKRASTRVEFRFSASAMVGARATITATPGLGLVGPSYLVVSRTVEIAGDMNVEMDLPYLVASPYSKIGPQWTFFVVLVSDIVSHDSSSVTPIVCTVWVAFPDLEVAIPSITKIEGLTPAYKNNFPTIIYGEMDSSPGMVGNSTDSGASKYGLSCSPTSLYHIMKRWSGYIASPGDGFCIAVEPGRVAYNTTTKNLESPIWFTILAMFKYYHGGFEFLSCPVKNIHMVGTVVGDNSSTHNSNVRVGLDRLVWNGGVLPLKLDTPLVHIPYRCEVPFTFVQYPVKGVEGFEKPTSVYYPATHPPHPFLVANQGYSTWPADDFEMFLFVGCPAMYFTNVIGG